MNEDKSLVIAFFAQVMLNFAAAVIAVSIAGWFVGDGSKDLVGLLRLGRDGISYSSLLQLFLFSIVSAGLKTLLFSRFVSQRMLLLWRASLMLMLSFLAATLLAVVFRWFPLGEWRAWLGFIIPMTACIVTAILFMLIKIKTEDKKYSKLLSNYKAKQKKKGSEKQ